ncbi:hypothetical protein FPV67DRAFT_1499193 [Lyophyllum atratum]|nr:hypothetical protein FPV67DRAFT_1499193 [Lyophyllum atratum]
MSGMITGPHFIKHFNAPGPIEVGTMVAVLGIGMFVTSFAAGRVGEVIGRRHAIHRGRNTTPGVC